MTETFQLLLEQIGLSGDDRLSAVFKSGRIIQAVLHSKSKHWEFVFGFDHLLPILDYQLFKAHLVQAFEKTGNQVTFSLQVAHKSQHPELVGEYYKEAFSADEVTKSPAFTALFKDLSVSIDKETLTITGPASIMQEVFQKSSLPALKRQLTDFGLGDLDIQLEVDGQLTKEQEDAYNRHQLTVEEAARRIHQQAQDGAIEEEKRQAKQAPGVSKRTHKTNLASAEVTAMSEIDGEESRIVFEGYVFAAEMRETRTGRVVINFKMTDYTTSFALQKWVKNSDEAKQYDMIQKGAWLRVRGNIEHSSYAKDLVMSVIEVQEEPHPIRQDLAPADERRVEFHAHTNMSTMDAMPSVEDLVARAADWGHRAVAITDHGNVQSFPHGYQAAKKAGIKPIFGMEANIVEDSVPIVYNPASLELYEATYVVFDVETTGLSAVYNDLIQIAASKMHKGNIIAEFDEFINPGYPLSSFTTDLTGITDEHVRDAKPLEDVLKAFQDFCEGSVLVAHNASFDVGFMNKNYERHGLSQITQPVIDTLELARNLYPDFKRHGLGPLTKRFGVTLDHHHMANYDAEATGRLLFIFLQEVRDTHGVTALDQLNTKLIQPDSYKKARIKHATLYVEKQVGLKNLFQLVSASHTQYFAGVPRIPRSLLAKHKEGLVMGSACSEGEVFETLVSKGVDAAVEVAKAYDFIEVMPPAIYAPLIAKEQFKDEAEIEAVIKDLLEVAKRADIPALATGNVHYLDPTDAIYREIIVRSLGQSSSINWTIGHGEQAQPAPLPEAHFRTTDEMLEAFAFLGEDVARQIVITNTQEMAERFEDIQVLRKELYTPYMKDAEEKVAQKTYDMAFRLYGNPLPDIVSSRIEKELTSIIGNGFAVIYLASQMLVERSNERGYLVGSRGSVGSSFVATMMGITEVNPLAPHYVCPSCQQSEFVTDGSVASGYDLPDKECPSCGAGYKKDGQDIPFETFLGFDGDKVPDIDLNFSGEDQPRAHLDVRDIFGEAHAFRAGTVGTVADKTAYGFVKGYEREYGKYYRDVEVERLAAGAAGVKRTTGQHPGGIVVIPDYMDVYDFAPIQYPADDLSAQWRTLHFEYHEVEDNLLKLDVLGHDDPTMVRKLQDLSGIDPVTIPMDDPDVMALFSGTDVLGVTKDQIGTPTGILGIPEFGTSFVRGMVEETKPTTFSELLQLSGLSHGTDVWLGNAQDLIKSGTAELSTVIGCRDDIMVYLMHAGLDPKLSFTIMERVRKGLWLKISEEERNSYIAEMQAHHVPDWYIESCGKVKYMFPKAHAAAYVMMALRVAYFKVHYPMYYYAAYFSIRAKAFDLDVMSGGLHKVKQKMDEIKGKMGRKEATKVEEDLYVTLELVNEMYERGYTFGKLDIYRSHATEFLIEGDTLIPPLVAMAGLGENVAKQFVAAREEGEFLSKTELRKRGGLNATLVEKLSDMGLLANLPDDNQLSLFDELF